MNYIRLELSDVLIAGLLVAGNGALSVWLGLGLEKRLAVASLRMVGQLLLVGLVLTWLFAHGAAWLTAAVALAMVLFAGWEILGRQ